MLKPVKRKNSPYWIARGSIDGHRIEVSTKEKDYKKARSICIQIASEYVNCSADKNAPITFEQAMNDYVSQGGERRYLPKLKKHFANTLLDDIDNRTMIYAANRLYPTAKPATINRQLFTPVSAIIRNAARDGLCQVREFKRPRSDNPRTRFMTPQEAETLIDATQQCRNGFMPALVTFLIGQGCRIGETLQIDGKDDVNLSGGYIILRPDHTKSGQERRVTLIPRVRAALSTLPTIGISGPLFRNERGLPYSLGCAADGSKRGGQIQAAFNSSVERAGLEGITPHICRHTWATWFYSQTRDPLRMKAEGGWAKDLWERYAKLAMPQLGDDARDFGWEFEPHRLTELGDSPTKTVNVSRRKIRNSYTKERLR